MPTAPWMHRFMALVIAVASLVVLIMAAGLTPSPTGVGSHQGLGLASCQMLDRTGIPCPGCGMTTSFAWFVRGHLVASFFIQPMGFALAAMAAVSVWGGFFVAATGRPIYRLTLLVPGRAYLIGLLGLAIAAWGWKILLRFGGWDGW